MLDQRLPLANAMNDVVSGTMPHDHPEIMHHCERFDFVPGIRNLSAAEMEPVNVMNQKTVLRQYVGSVKHDYDYLLLVSRILGGGRHDETCRNGAENQVQIKLKLKNGSAFFSDELGKEQFA